MDRPNYDGLIEDWKIELIVQRAKRWGFKEHEIPDVLQDVVLELLEFEGDPDKAQGAQERTLLHGFVDNCLKPRRRAASRYEAKLARLSRFSQPDSYSSTAPLAIDIAATTTPLTPEEQRVCRLLATGHTRNAIARQLGCGWHTIDRMIEQLRERFEELELDGWVGE